MKWNKSDAGKVVLYSTPESPIQLRRPKSMAWYSLVENGEVIQVLGPIAFANAKKAAEEFIATHSK